jgi:hypothetical protein
MHLLLGSRRREEAEPCCREVNQAGPPRYLGGYGLGVRCVVEGAWRLAVNLRFIERELQTPNNRTIELRTRYPRILGGSPGLSSVDPRCRTPGVMRSGVDLHAVRRSRPDGPDFRGSHE